MSIFSHYDDLCQYHAVCALLSHLLLLCYTRTHALCNFVIAYYTVTSDLHTAQLLASHKGTQEAAILVLVVLLHVLFKVTLRL